ncbi:MAG: hypothetical protein M1500_02945 [Candidatus Marsarchaeota archaeon]|jgi:hypothetical protein|nr:hypothetical protein [Candidatus Marsarchaeota archaeon]MCL5112639.1 hypothetical protein [Candidatus Marsarchaeota archaeon]
MVKSQVDEVTEETIAKGGVLVKMYFDMQSNEKDKLQPLLVDLINKHLLKEKGVVYCYGAVEEPLENKGIFVSSAEVTLLVKSFFSLVSISFNYAPAGIEIIKPMKDMKFNVNDLQSMLMDLSQLSLGYSKFMLERVLKPEDLQNIEKQIENRVELGKKLIEKKGGSEGESKKD